MSHFVNFWVFKNKRENLAYHQTYSGFRKLSSSWVPSYRQTASMHRIRFALQVFYSGDILIRLLIHDHDPGSWGLSIKSCLVLIFRVVWAGNCVSLSVLQSLQHCGKMLKLSATWPRSDSYKNAFQHPLWSQHSDSQDRTHSSILLLTILLEY